MNEIIPSKLYKFFTELAHAEALLSGNVRFGTLLNYQTTEDLERKDKTEGRGELMVPGESIVIDPMLQTMHSVPGVETLSVNSDPRNHFVYCLTYCQENEIHSLASKFGSYCVAINDPSLLIQDITEAIAKDSALSINSPKLEWGEVEYGKAGYSDIYLSKAEKSRLAWCQKPPQFKIQKEFRLHFNFTSHELIQSPDYYPVSIGKLLDYCKLLDI